MNQKNANAVRKTRKLFASEIYHHKVLSPQSRLHREICAEAPFIRERDKKGQQWSRERYPNGYTSYGSYDQLHQLSSTFEALRKRIDLHAHQFARALGFSIHPKELQMTRMWLNMMGQNCGHGAHIHPLSTISGSYYVEMPKGAAAIKFEDPRLNLFMARPPVLDNRGSMPAIVEVHPRPGDIVLFESWMRHEVPLHSADALRVSVSFNYDWIGKS